ncbi:adenosylcobinamide-GDP ribazoletransferase [bacterium]|nr:adenosylcobinamide-GDP ribazoletransferase [bacterium]
MTLFRIALTFLTTLPIPPVANHAFERDPSITGRAFAWYPAVGLVIGLILAAVNWLLAQTALQPNVIAGLVLGAWIVLTGALHLDGLMDSCDALFAPVEVPRRLEILKDVHPGAFGVVGLLWLVGFKWTLLAQLAPGSLALPALLFAPIWGRWMLVFAAQRFAYARPGSSLGQFMRNGLGTRQLLAATLFTLTAQIVLSLFWPPLWWAILAPIAGIVLARWAASRLGGGLTGDLYGALCEVTETAVLLAVAIAV